MSLPQSLRTSVTPPELELIASQQLIEIIPLIAIEKTAFISGAFGPLQPPRKAQIPLWMAINLKLKKKCHIVAPEWLSVEFLQSRLDEEINEPGFSKLPFRYAEVSKLLLDVQVTFAPDDIQSTDKIRYLLKDLREARQAKSREGVDQINRGELSLSNLCSMEINEIRPFFVHAMGILTHLHRDASAEDQP
ncbi:DNA replication complex GINS protein PSF2 [Lentinula guzmanii]|uniref:DNA replication complex GINS protein PSF2 n=2 Tax=Lentinula TaxID=5352 RepID=A0AA38JM34_9AGAR|nr:DNA replication complex GINS protein PSF2 [Lentinula guzmanii]KAJ3986656.1 DNA replication complex GINS protein PSF2 [Lentinula detonsa]